MKVDTHFFQDENNLQSLYDLARGIVTLQNLS